MKKTNRIFAFAAIMASTLLVGCADSKGFSDINAWMAEQSKGVKGKVDPLPQAKTFTPRDFIAKQNPFEEKEALSLSTLDSNKYAPDPNRRKDPLEGYALEALRMVGFLESEDGPQAIINTTDKKIHHVGLNNYMGKNYGLVTKITEGQMILEERVIAGDGSWTLREAVVYLEDGSRRK